MAGPTLTPDLTGNPFVEVFFEDLHVDAVTITIYRLSEDREWLVRGGVEIATGVAALDFEVPFQTPSTYRAEQFDAFDNSLGFTDSSDITIEYEGTVIHQPLSPAQLWVPVTIAAGSAESLVRPSEGDFVHTEGATVGRWIGTPRQGLRGVAVRVLTDTLAAADQMQATLGTYMTQQIGVLCIRTSDGIRWPRTFFARGVLVEADWDVALGGTSTLFTSSMDETEPPFPGLVVPLLTYDDLDFAYADYDARDAAYLTYTQMDRDYSLAGIAG